MITKETKQIIYNWEDIKGNVVLTRLKGNRFIMMYGTQFWGFYRYNEKENTLIKEQN